MKSEGSMSESQWLGFEGDSQGTEVEPCKIENFDFERFREKEAESKEKRDRFVSSPEGVLIHRRFRVPRVFSYGCADMKESLEWQLGALQTSLDYPMDIPNFLEPWYGIGTVASCFGAEYAWKDGQAPAVPPPFTSIDEALDFDPVPVESTQIGITTLEMIEYFLEETGGKLPVSFTDTQSPSNIAASLLDTTSYLLGLFDHPEKIQTLIDRIVSLIVDFTQKQRTLIGDALVLPGHGFAACREFTGLGMSDDSSSMLSPGQFRLFNSEAMSRTGTPFGGAVYHSCGNWESRLSQVLGIEGLVSLDAAFTADTDSDPNRAGFFTEAMRNTGIVLNARCAGSPETIKPVIKELVKPGMKSIIVTYARTVAEQQEIIRYIEEESDAEDSL
jgi:hypothetical protein